LFVVLSHASTIEPWPMSKGCRVDPGYWQGTGCDERPKGALCCGFPRPLGATRNALITVGQGFEIPAGVYCGEDEPEVPGLVAKPVSDVA
jgi:hypothetical protein